LCGRIVGFTRMAKGKKDGPSKKEVEKKINKVVEDKTFGVSLFSQVHEEGTGSRAWVDGLGLLLRLIDDLFFTLKEMGNY